MELTQKQIHRFWSKVDKKEDGCWEWNASKDKDGYGQIMFNYKGYRSHRISWILENGDIPEGMFVCHKCDSPGCSRPDHLFLGTHQENMNDMTNKNRQAYGENNGKHKLTEQQVFEIRQKYIPRIYTLKKLGDEYNVSKMLIGDIINNKNWKYLLKKGSELK